MPGLGLLELRLDGLILRVGFIYRAYGYVLYLFAGRWTHLAVDCRFIYKTIHMYGRVLTSEAVL
jgi:hypothetical protein